MPEIKLTYFDIPGLAEPIRLILAYGQIDYEDCRLTREDFASKKESFPMGKLPILEIEKQTLNQSQAICRFLAKRVGLAGDNEWEAVMADIQVDNFGELKGALGFRNEENEEIKAKKRDEALNTHIPYILSRLEKHVEKNGGHFVNGKLTWADLSYAAMTNSINQIAGTDVFAPYPKLQELRKKVYDLPQLQKYLSSRPA